MLSTYSDLASLDLWHDSLNGSVEENRDTLTYKMASRTYTTLDDGVV